MLYYKIKGEGETVIFLHGYLENSELWEDFTDKLDKYRCILIDLPGCGKSELPELKKKFIGGYEVVEPLKPSIEQMAEEVIKVLKHNNINKAHFIGHSMGGYVCLAILELYPDVVKSLCLLNSHPFADTPEKKEARAKEIEIIKQGKKNTLIEIFVQKLYNPSFNNYKYIELSKQMAYSTHEDTMIYCLLAMKDRSDRSNVLSATNKPILWIIGELDTFVPMHLIEKLEDRENIKKIFIKNSAHMSIFENPEEVRKILSDFINKYK